MSDLISRQEAISKAKELFEMGDGKCPYSKNKTCSACKVLKIACDGTKYINCEQYLETCAESNTCERCKHLYYQYLAILHIQKHVWRLSANDSKRRVK